MWIRIRVAGTVEVKADPEWVRKFCNPGPPSECPPPYDGASVGPLGVENGLVVQVAMHNAYYMWTPQSVDGATAEDVMWVSAGTPVLVGRTGLYDLGDCYACTHDPDRAGHYLLSGGQTVTVEEFNPLSVRADQEQVDPATKVNFTATGPGALRGLRWAFIEGDTLPAATAAASRAPGALLSTSVTSPNWSALSECEGKTTCAMNVTKSGRMRARGIMDNNVVDALSQVVRVTPLSLSLSCVPSRLPRGNTTTCTATAQPGSATFTVESFSFAGDSGATASQVGGTRSWSFQPPQSGTVTVAAKVAGINLTAQARVEVVCNFLKHPSGDPILDHAEVQDRLRQLWAASNPGDPGPGRIERGMVITSNGGVYTFNLYQGPSTRCSSGAGNMSLVAHEIVAMVHTHPDPPGAPWPVECDPQPAGTQIKDGPSEADRNSQRLLSQKVGRPIPSYIIEPNHVHRHGSGIPRLKRDRNPTC
jgi:hypothetical protein